MNGFLKKGFKLLSESILQDNSQPKFEEIIGHTGIKMILNKAIISKKPVNVLLLGKPACAKTMFLTEIMRSCKKSLFLIGSNTTKAGLVNQLFESRPKFLLIDELEKMNRTDQTSLLNLMETRIISETKINKTRQIELTSWVFATANSSDKIIEPLLSRFVVLKVPEYSFEEFREIAVGRLRKENVDRILAVTIAEKVWRELGSKDIRDVIKVARLANYTEEISFVINMMEKRIS
jgi:Holliday junction DNA helicase RuvB